MEKLEKFLDEASGVILTMKWMRNYMDPMIAAASSFQQATIMSKIDFAVAKKILDTQSQQGNSALELVDAADKGFNQAGDSLVAATTGLGGSVDAYA